MAALVNFPMLSQRDGDANANYDCVPASIAACMEYLTSKKYTASEIKDAVYGTGYTGGTAASAYVAYCAQEDVTLSPVDGNGAQLVASLRGSIASGHPCLITEPDPYSSGWTHVCAAYAFDDASITVMDPWIDSPVKKADGTWAAQLQDNQIWVLEKASTPVVERTTWMSAGQQAQAEAYWGSVDKVPYTTGIALSWQDEYMSGRIWGPPLAGEVDTVDWNGNKIVAQMFAGGRCEWSNGQAKWYAWT